MPAVFRLGTTLKVDPNSTKSYESQIRYLAKMEYLIKMITHGNHTFGDDEELALPPNLTMIELQELKVNGNALRSVKQNADKARTLLFEENYQVFKPRNQQSLARWLSEEDDYNDGAQVLPHDLNTEMNSSNYQPWFTDSCMSCIRHILFAHYIHLTRFPSLMVYFDVLLLGRVVVSLKEFPSICTLTAQFMRLDIQDWEIFIQGFERKLEKKAGGLFPCYWYSTSDNSDNNGDARHVAIMSAEDENCDPCLHFLTVVVANSKDSEGNSDLNAKFI
jgi:hypothetical protein